MEPHIYAWTNLSGFEVHIILFLKKEFLCCLSTKQLLHKKRCDIFTKIYMSSLLISFNTC